VVLILVFIGAMSSGALAKRQQDAPYCDFAQRFTGAIRNLPQDRYVVIRTHDPLDPWVMSVMMGYLYYTGPYGEAY